MLRELTQVVLAIIFNRKSEMLARSALDYSFAIVLECISLFEPAVVSTWFILTPRHHWSNSSVPVFTALQPTAVLSLLCSLWAAGWSESIRFPFSQDKEVGRGFLCTPGQPSWLCPGFLCWGCVPSSCSSLTDSQTVERELWKALGSDPFPEKREKHNQIKLQH